MPPPVKTEGEIIKIAEETIALLSENRTGAISPGDLDAVFTTDHYDRDGKVGRGHWVISWNYQSENIPLAGESGSMQIEDDGKVVMLTNNRFSFTIQKETEGGGTRGFDANIITGHMEDKDVFGNTLEMIASTLCPEVEGQTIEFAGPEPRYVNPRLFVPMEGIDGALDRESAHLSNVVYYIRRNPGEESDLCAMCFWFSPDGSRLYGYSSPILSKKSLLGLVERRAEVDGDGGQEG